MARELQPCGTPAAYIRHWRRNEKPCAPCEEAHRTKCREAARKAAKKLPSRRVPANGKPCKDCGRRRKRREGAYGWCNACYLRWLYAGRPDDGPPPPYDPERRRNNRREEYVFLRDTGDSPERAAERLDADRRTAAAWEAYYQREAVPA